MKIISEENKVDVLNKNHEIKFARIGLSTFMFIVSFFLIYGAFTEHESMSDKLEALMIDMITPIIVYCLIYWFIGFAKCKK